jgi:broad-specificity NMP kinase
MAGNIVHLIGFPGVGKLTIAKEVIRQRPDFVLVDNHLINNPVFSVVKADGKTPLPAEIWAKASQIRAIVLDTMATLSPSRLSFVMTNVAVEDEEDKAECRKIEAVAEQRGGQYFPVILTCDVEENRRRIVSPERGPNLKSIDPNEPDRLHKGTRLLSFEGHPNRIQMDVTRTRPAEAAKRILQAVGRTRTNTATVKATECRP